MVKANAYGHDLGWVGRQLLDLPGLYGFGVASLEEGKELRQELGAHGKRARIIVFSGANPWTEGKGQFCERHGLTPVIATDADWEKFLKQGWPEKIAYELKFNTGMNRLGMSPKMASQVVKALRGERTEWHPHGVLSHLAIAEEPDHRLSLEQRRCFEAIRSEMHAAFPAAQFHLGNSAAIWNEKHWRLEGFTDVVRPGLSLYGVPPWKDAPIRGLEPVMSLKASLIQIHHLKPGDSVGYGGTYQVSSKDHPQGMKVGLISAGYGDGLHRMLSSKGWAWIAGQPKRLLGRVSMDLAAVECPPAAKIGDWVELFGPNIDPWAQSELAGTIPYELLTSVGNRVQRIHG